MRTVTDEERRARLGVRHGLAVPLASVLEATRAMTCLHATEPASVYLAAWARTGASREAIDVALYDDRTVVRQLAMRRTVFAFPVELLPAVRGSAAARTAAQQQARLAKEVVAYGIAEDGEAWLRSTSAAVLAAIRERPRTSAELREAVPAMAERLVDPGGSIPIGPRLLTVLAADGCVVRGRNTQGWKVSRPEWTAVEAWLGEEPATSSVAEGYAELVSHWLWTFGPGTEDDLVWWLGATKAAVRRALADLGAVTVLLEDGREAWLRADDVDPVGLGDAGEPGEWAALLPALDPTTMGWKERGFHLGPHAGAIFDRNGNGGATAWWCGRIVGSWAQADDGTVEVLPLEEVPDRARRALAVEAERLTAWLDGDVVRSVYAAPAGRAHLAARSG